MTPVAGAGGEEGPLGPPPTHPPSAGRGAAGSPSPRPRPGAASSPPTVAGTTSGSLPGGRPGGSGTRSLFSLIAARPQSTRESRENVQVLITKTAATATCRVPDT